MEIPLGIGFNGIDAFILVFVRMTGMFVIAPIFGRRNIPTILKIGLAFFLALLLINTIKVPNLSDYSNIYQFAVLVFKEFIVGLTIGYISYLVFMGIYMSGQLIDMQVGFGMVNVLDPVSNIQVPITSNFYFILSMMIFLAANGHHVLIRALFESYQVIPLGGAVFNSNLMVDIIRVTGNMFLVGFKIAAPVIAAILISDIALGVMAKTVPQLNVFVIGMPLKIVLGIAVIIITMPVFISFIDILRDGMSGELLNFIKNMGLKK
ncbi:MAG: flagellar biosynthetic protein FliR [Clostridia bacterium]|nr:flagellar biosynthetic protein FliR [Clostridia bacterium]